MSELAILGLLRIKPMHGYEIQTIIQQSKMDEWANLLSGSIYYAITKLEKEKFIEPSKEERTGSRIRVVYRISEKGEEHYQNLLYEKLQQQPHSTKSDFLLALSMLGNAGKEEIIHALERNLEQLRAYKKEWISRKEIKQHTDGFTKIMAICFDSTIEIINVDIKTLESIIEHVKNT